MNKKSSLLGASDFANQEYVSTQAFMEYLAKTNDLPYQSMLSLKPFIDKLQHLEQGTCDYTKAAIGPIVKNTKHHFSKKDVDLDFEEMDDLELQKMLGIMFPAMFLNNQQTFIAPPFKKQFRFQSPATKALFSSGEWVMKVDFAAHKEKMISTPIKAGAFLLKKFYNIDIDDFHSQIITLKNIKTGLEKHCEVKINTDFVDAIAIKPLKKLSKKQISQLLNNIHEEALWLAAFPAENFKFEGFSIGTFYDVTSTEIMSILKNKVTLEEEDMSPEVFFPFLQQQLKNHLKLSSLEVGMVMVTFEEFFTGRSFSLTGINDKNIIKGNKDNPSIYKQAFSSNRPILFDDLSNTDKGGRIKNILLKKGIKGLILLPIYASSGKLSSIFEIGTSEAMKFNALTILKLREFFDLMTLGSERYLRSMDSMVSMFIQQQFTSIHQSVKWKFEEVATKYEVQRTIPDFDGEIDPIVFKDIYPLYGQADIVSSSKLRNKSIQIDLTDNLTRVLNLMNIWNDHLQFHLLESYILKVESILNRIEKEFISSDESLIVELLTQEIHPLLHQLNERYSEMPSEPYLAYLDHLDSDLHIVYNHRKDYEHSVSQLNAAISTFLENDDQKMQKILPHYFEKYKTDGIEYNIYIGESLLKDGGFSPFFLKDFRIWQLVNACEITRLVEELSPKLPVPLKTAQLLFVYNNSLSIRFRMDEKQFDVDGSYNVRYEILKKRIDKAVVKNTGERLTVAGKVAIVYLQDKDRIEYLEYLDYLIQKGFIDPDIEDLELDKLQGAEGLKALRVRVIS